MRILITGAQGYVASAAIPIIRAAYPDATLIGTDTSYFAPCIVTGMNAPDAQLDTFIQADIRTVDYATFGKLDAAIHLAAISNDPIGNQFEEVTAEVNTQCAIRLAEYVKSCGGSRFIFASSCMVYGEATGGPRTEADPVGPITAYAKSKINSEIGLAPLSDDGFQITALRFCTAFGLAPRLRLDLVINDFVASAVTTGKIEILSDGSPWRPLIHVRDMARAMVWALQRDSKTNGPAQPNENFLALNVGRDENTWQIGELAKLIAGILGGIDVSINTAAAPDRRSYKVDFGKFTRLAPGFVPCETLEGAVRELEAALRGVTFENATFRESPFVRLYRLRQLQSAGQLDDKLRWRAA